MQFFQALLFGIPIVTAQICKPPPVEPLPPKEADCKILAVNDALGCIVDYSKVCKGSVPQSPGCPRVTAPPEKADCVWIGINDPLTGCVTSFRCQPKCPKVPFPTISQDCIFFFPVFNNRGCISSYECNVEAKQEESDEEEDPVLAPVFACKNEPKPPANTSSCTYVPISDKVGCITKYECSEKEISTSKDPKKKEQSKGEKIPSVAENETAEEETLDSDKICCWWAYKGECEKNPFWMKVNCQKSCGTKGCTEKADKCKVNISVDGCPYIPANSTTTVPLTTTTTVTTTVKSKLTTPKDCLDKHTLCPFWASIGECDRNSVWMRFTCKKTCSIQCH